MENFLEIKFGGIAGVGLLVSFILLFVGVGFSIYAELTKTNGGTREKVAIKCTNENCDYSDILSYDESLEWTKEQYENLKQSNPDLANQLVYKILNRLQSSLGNEAGASAMTQESAEALLLRDWGSGESNLPFVCPKCAEKKVFKAILCGKCGNIFFPDSTRRYIDECPQCGHSKREQEIKYQQEKKK